MLQGAAALKFASDTHAGAERALADLDVYEEYAEAPSQTTGMTQDSGEFGPSLAPEEVEGFPQSTDPLLGPTSLAPPPPTTVSDDGTSVQGKDPSFGDLLAPVPSGGAAEPPPAELASGGDAPPAAPERSPSAAASSAAAGMAASVAVALAALI